MQLSASQHTQMGFISTEDAFDSTQEVFISPRESFRYDASQSDGISVQYSPNPSLKL